MKPEKIAGQKRKSRSDQEDVKGEKVNGEAEEAEEREVLKLARPISSSPVETNVGEEDSQMDRGGEEELERRHTNMNQSLTPVRIFYLSSAIGLFPDFHLFAILAVMLCFGLASKQNAPFSSTAFPIRHPLLTRPETFGQQNTVLYSRPDPSFFL